MKKSVPRGVTNRLIAFRLGGSDPPRDVCRASGWSHESFRAQRSYGDLLALPPFAPQFIPRGVTTAFEGGGTPNLVPQFIPRRRRPGSVWCCCRGSVRVPRVLLEYSYPIIIDDAAEYLLILDEIHSFSLPTEPIPQPHQRSSPKQ